MEVKGNELKYHSGGMRGPSYFTTATAFLDVRLKKEESGVNGKIGPFIKVGDVYFTKQQAEELAQTIAAEAAKIP